MIPLAQAHKILAAIGVARPDNEAQFLAARILADPLVASRVQEFIFSGAGAAPEALAALHPLEKAALFSRLRIAGSPAAPPRGKAVWRCGKSNVSDKPLITVGCSICGQSSGFADPLNKQFSFAHCGVVEEVPSEVMNAYTAALQALGDPNTRKFEYATFREQWVQQNERDALRDRNDAMRLLGENDPQVAPPPAKFID